MCEAYCRVLPDVWAQTLDGHHIALKVIQNELFSIDIIWYQVCTCLSGIFSMCILSLRHTKHMGEMAKCLSQKYQIASCGCGN